MEDILSIMSNLQPNCCFKVDFQKADEHAGGKWLIHDTKRRKDNQSLWHKGVRWHHVESDILKEGPEAKTSWKVRDCRTPKT